MTRLISHCAIASFLSNAGAKNVQVGSFNILSDKGSAITPIWAVDFIGRFDQSAEACTTISGRDALTILDAIPDDSPAPNTNGVDEGASHASGMTVVAPQPFTKYDFPALAERLQRELNVYPVRTPHAAALSTDSANVTGTTAVRQDQQ